MQERINKIISYLEENNVSQASLGKSASLSPTVVNQLLKGTYKGDVDSNLLKIEKAIQNQKDKLSVSFKAPNFVYTDIVRKVHNSLAEAQNSAIPKILVLYGESGIGKTKTLENFIEENPSSNIAKVLRGWSSLEGLVELFNKDIGIANYNLQNASYATMANDDGLGLR